MLNFLDLFIELVLRNTKTIDMFVVLLGSIYIDNAKWFEKLLQMVETTKYLRNLSGFNLES